MAGGCVFSFLVASCLACASGARFLFGRQWLEFKVDLIEWGLRVVLTLEGMKCGVVE